MSVVTSSSSGAKSGGLESVKYYVFDGENEEGWHEYCIKTLAFADAKGWSEGLTKDDAAKEHHTSAKIISPCRLLARRFDSLIKQ